MTSTTLPKTPRRRCCLMWPIALRRPSPPTFTLPPIFCISPTVRRWIRIAIQYSLLAFVLLILIVWIGAEVEGYHVQRAADTVHFYQTPHVCGIESNDDNNDDDSLTIQTYSSAEDVDLVAHCGDCGQCSNPNDINIYDETKNTLFSQTADCAKRGFLFGRKTAHSCMEQVGLTEGCNDCWVDNIMCDLRYCVFTCMWQGIFDQVDNSETGLNRCTHCDEVRCGPAFVTCAGANRRRSGILSDIDRDLEKEVCATVTPEWWKDPMIQEKWDEQQQEQLTEEEGTAATATAGMTDEQENLSGPPTRVRRR